MESFTFGVPTYWSTTTENLVSQVTESGRVHSGQSAVSLSTNANLSQVVNTVRGGCFYEFSFFANAIGCNVALSATVTFLTPGGETQGALISLESRDIPNTGRNFGYYKVMTTAAPENTYAARITFVVSTSGCQSVVIDDVSLTVQ